MLEDEGHVALRRRLACNVAAADLDTSGVWLFQPGDQPQRRRLAGTRRSEQHDELAVADGKIQVGDRLRFAEALAQPLENDVRHVGPRH